MRKLFSTLFLFSSLLTFAQSSDLGNWLIYFGNMELKDGFNWHNEAQVRNYNAIGDLEQLLLRTGIGYNLTEGNNNVLLGYGYILSENYLENSDEKEAVHEHRIFQQFITRQKIGHSVGVQHRYRFEQRFIAEDFKLRFRYFLGLNIDLNKSKDLYLSMYNEIFLNTNGVIFDRNRLYGGLGYRLNPKLRFELGYMNQFFSEGGRDQINIMAFVNF